MCVCGASSSPVITGLKTSKALNLWIICVLVRPAARAWVCVCVCTHQSFSPCLTTWLSGPERNWDDVFSGIWRQGRCHRSHRANMTSNTHTHTRSFAYINCPPSLSHSGSTPQGPSNVHSHMHKRARTYTHKHKHTHYATRLQTLLVCVWNERRVVRKTACLKKEPCPASGTNTTQSRDSVATAFSLSIFSPSSCPCLFLLIFSVFIFGVGLLALN